MPRNRAIVWIAIVLLPLLASSARAQDAGKAALPTGHPRLDDANPHGHAGGMAGGAPAMFEPPADVEEPDSAQAPGTIVVDLRDADDKPVAHQEVTLGVLVNSAASGENRKHVQATTDQGGRAVFSGLDQASNTAYRVSAAYQGATFAATPFQLQPGKAMRVVLHVYPVTHDIQQALIVAEATVACEVREDHIQVEEALTLYNLGRTAWIPDDVRMKLPAGFSSFGVQPSMSDQGVDAVEGSARLHGTFPPGRHSVEFHWVVPWSGERDVHFDVGLPPHVAIARVMMPATSDIQLVADGFPPTEVKEDQGQSFLVTERRLRPDDPKLTSVSVNLHDLPAPGRGRSLSSLLAAWVPDMFEPPADVEEPEPMRPPGVIVVDVRDPDEKPVAHEEVTLGVLINSVAKGDSRKHVQATTDDAGRVTFAGLELASNIAYRVSVGYQGGAFAATPFQLQQAKAMHVVLHVFPVTHDAQHVVSELTVASEVREDRIQVEQALTIYNLGRSAWVPDDVRLKLPPGYTAFNAQTSMSDQGVDEVEGTGRLRGTFPPGRHSVVFRWQVPWSGEKDVDFDVGAPPRVAYARVLMPAAGDIKLVATGFPSAELTHDQQGQGFLVTERRFLPEDPKLLVAGVGIHDLPTPGPGRLLATLLAACGVASGLALALSGRRGRSVGGEAKTTRATLLEELAELERARESGDVGPKTYERVRRELIDALARTLVKS
jgi:hypothetical protein